MDILNFISWTRNGRTVSTVDSANTLVPVGLKDPKRDDGYLAGAISVTDFLTLVPTPPTVINSVGTSLYSVTPAAGPFNTSQHNTLFGANAGANTNTEGLICIGNGAGAQSQPNSSPNYSTFLGYNAGTNARNAIHSFFAGQSAGSGAPNAAHAVMIGNLAGHSSTGGAYSNFLGFEAGKQGDEISHSNFLGKNAGTRAWFTQHSNFFGTNAGYQATNSSNSNFFGEEAGMGASANNVNAFGKAAHKNGTLDGQTVFANVTLPSYANRSAATTAITVPNGAIAGNTYLYYNQTTFAIEGVRL
jgi:hypothetical protein